jgi:hypothetical protein
MTDLLTIKDIFTILLGVVRDTLPVTLGALIFCFVVLSFFWEWPEKVWNKLLSVARNSLPATPNVLISCFISLSFFWERMEKVWNKLFREKLTRAECFAIVPVIILGCFIIFNYFDYQLTLVSEQYWEWPSLGQYCTIALIISWPITFLVTYIIWIKSKVKGGIIRRSLLFLLILGTFLALDSTWIMLASERLSNFYLQTGNIRSR